MRHLNELTLIFLLAARDTFTHTRTHILALITKHRRRRCFVTFSSITPPLALVLYAKEDL